MDDKYIIRIISVLGILESALFILMGLVFIYTAMVISGQPNVPFLSGGSFVAASVMILGILSGVLGAFGLHAFYKIYRLEQFGVPRVILINSFYSIVFFLSFGADIISYIVIIILLAEIAYIWTKRDLFVN